MDFTAELTHSKGSVEVHTTVRDGRYFRQDYYWVLTPKEEKQFKDGNIDYFKKYRKKCRDSIFMLNGQMRGQTYFFPEEIEIKTFDELNSLTKKLKAAHIEWIRAESILKAINNGNV